jgi:hypothetical protein
MEALGELDMRGNVQVRGRGFGKEVLGRLGEVGLGRMVHGCGGERACGRKLPEVLSCGGGGDESDREWEEGVVV